MLFKGASGGRAVRLLHGVNALPLRVKAADLASRSLAAASIRANGQSSFPLANSHPAIAHPSLLLHRQFADRVVVSRPKAHTGRSTSPRKTSTTKKRTTKTKTAAKPKPKPKKKVKKPLSPEDKQKQEVRKLKKEILKPPKELPATAWTVLFAEQSKGVPGRIDAAAAAAKYRNLSASEREQYNHQANENKAKNVAAYKRWIESQNPNTVKQANHARERLVKLGARKRLATLKDERTPKRPRTAYTYFFKERHDSGDFAGVKIVDSGRLIAQEWKALGGSQKQKYLDSQARDLQRYNTETKRVYGGS